MAVVFFSVSLTIIMLLITLYLYTNYFLKVFLYGLRNLHRNMNRDIYYQTFLLLYQRIKLYLGVNFLLFRNILCYTIFRKQITFVTEMLRLWTY